MFPTIHSKGFPMNTADLADTLATKLGLSKADARRSVDATFEAIADAAAKGDEVSINGFGKFAVKPTAARTGRNPATGAEIEIAAGKKVSFSAAKALKDKVSA